MAVCDMLVADMTGWPVIAYHICMHLLACSLHLQHSVQLNMQYSACTPPWNLLFIQSWMPVTRSLNPGPQQGPLQARTLDCSYLTLGKTSVLWMDGWMDGCMDGCMDGLVNE